MDSLNPNVFGDFLQVPGSGGSRRNSFARSRPASPFSVLAPNSQRTTPRNSARGSERQRKFTMAVSPYGGSGGGRTTGQSRATENAMDEETLINLQAKFDEADEDGGGGLDPEEFRNVMRETFGDTYTFEEIDKIFMKVDANCDGTVDFDEYLSFMLLEYTQKTDMNSEPREIPFEDSPQEMATGCVESIVRICLLPSRNRDEGSARYLLICKDGMLTTVDPEKSLLGSVVRIPYPMKLSDIMITDAVAYPPLNYLFVSTVNTDLLLCCFTPNNCEILLRIVQLPHTVVTMHLWIDPSNSGKGVLVLGDNGGGVTVIKFTDAQGKGFFPALDYIRKGELHFNDLQFIDPSVTSTEYFPDLHKNWVSQVWYEYSMDSVVSSSRDGSTSVRIKHMPGKRHDIVINVSRGITCFAYSDEKNILVSGCVDHMVRIWNPQVPSKPTAILDGHVSTILHVAIHEKSNYVLSCAVDKAIRVHDMNDHSCIQILFSATRLAVGKLDSMFFNPQDNKLLIGSKTFLAYSKEAADPLEMFLEKTTHPKPLCAALYTPLFNYVVSADLDSTVKIWDLATGALLMQFEECHTRREGSQVEPVEITAMAFDETQRRLITGGADGTVKVWNFNSSALLRECDIWDETEVTSIECARDKILVGGWSKRIIQHNDDPEDTTSRAWDKKHNDDITAIASYGKYLVTGSFDGDIIVWLTDTNSFVNRISIRTSSLKQKKPASLKPEYKPTVLFKSQGKTEMPKQEKSFHLQKAFLHRTRSQVYGSLSGFAADQGGQQQRGRTRTDDCESYRILSLLMLKERVWNPWVAQIVVGGSQGMIHFVSGPVEGGLLTEFALSDKQEDLLCMKTDPENKFLFVGDSDGYLTTFYIEYFRSGNDPFDGRDFQEISKRFSFLSDSVDTQKLHPAVSEDWSDVLDGEVPIVVNRFQAHITAIVSVDFAPDHEILITGSTDHNIRLWSLYGGYLRQFGGSKLWKMPNVRVLRQYFGQLPPDISRVGTPRTLRVLHGGTPDKWKKAQNTIYKTIVRGLRTQEHNANTSKRTESPETRGMVLQKFFDRRLADKRPTRNIVLPPIREVLHKVNAFQAITVATVHAMPEFKTPDIVRSLQRHKALEPTARRKPRKTRTGNSAAGRFSRMSGLSVSQSTTFPDVAMSVVDQNRRSRQGVVSRSTTAASMNQSFVKLPPLSDDGV